MKRYLNWILMLALCFTAVACSSAGTDLENPDEVVIFEKVPETIVEEKTEEKTDDNAHGGDYEIPGLEQREPFEAQVMNEAPRYRVDNSVPMERQRIEPGQPVEAPRYILP